MNEEQEVKKVYLVAYNVPYEGIFDRHAFLTIENANKKLKEMQQRDGVDGYSFWDIEEIDIED